MSLTLSEEQKRLVWDVLVETCGARPRQWDEFTYHFPQCREFRFQGALGFGGKVWADSRRVYVTCYSEDTTDERTDMIGAANSALLRISAGSPTP